MPLIKPEAQKILREAGLFGQKPSRPESDSATIQEKMEVAGLDDEMLLESLYDLAKLSGNEALRLRAVETALKMRGALKETAPAPPSFTIVIQPSNFQNAPQQAQVPEGVNPILLPRQLLESKDKDTIQ